jgi:DNA-binding LytR/AlgR family response regulator
MSAWSPAMLLDSARSRLVETQPLQRLWPLIVGTTAGLTLYCLAHAAVAGDTRAPLWLSPAWGLQLALIWWLAWEALKRIPAASGRWLLALLTLGVALLGNVLVEAGLATLAFAESTLALADRLHARLPLAALLGLAAWLRWAGTGSACASPRPTARSTENATVLQVPTREGPVALLGESIHFVRAAGNYVELHCAGRSYLLRETLLTLQARLEGEGFVRVHRSLLVNRAQVRGIRRDRRGLPCLQMACGTRLPVGRRYQDALKQLPDSGH